MKEENLVRKCFSSPSHIIGALEIEHLVKEYISHQQTDNVLQIITALRHDFIQSSSNNSRKGGLIAMAAIGLGLGEVSVQNSESY